MLQKKCFVRVSKYTLNLVGPLCNGDAPAALFSQIHYISRLPSDEGGTLAARNSCKLQTENYFTNVLCAALFFWGVLEVITVVFFLARMRQN